MRRMEGDKKKKKGGGGGKTYKRWKRKKGGLGVGPCSKQSKWRKLQEFI